MAEDKKKEIDVTVIEVTEEYLKEKLYKIRGKRVLLDADLAEIYGYDTKGFNRQVKNNPYPEVHPRSYGECPRMSCLLVDYPCIFCAVPRYLVS